MTTNKLILFAEFLIIFVVPLSPRRETTNPCCLGMSPDDIL